MGYDSSWLNAGIRLELEQLENYLHELTKALKISAESFDKYLESEAKKMSDDERDEFYHWHTDKHWELNDVFPIIMNNSLCIVIHSYLEAALINISNHFERKTPMGIKRNDLRGDTMEQCKIFLKKLHFVEIPDNSIEWQNITMFKKIRNAIVHNDRSSRNIKYADDIKQFSENNPGWIKINGHNQIEVLSEGNAQFISDVRKFLLELVDHSGL